MTPAHSRRRHAATLVLLLVFGPRGFALNPALDVSQYAHTAWKNGDGFSKSHIHQIIQTPDGYLWLATDSGLLRFDGTRTVEWQPPTDPSLPSTSITNLVVARDGTFWIGTRAGLASWKSGKLIVYPELVGSPILSLVEDHEGSIWVGAFGTPVGRLCEIRKGSFRCHPEIGDLGVGAFGLHEDGKGNLWVGLRTGVWRWKPGPPEFYATPLEQNGIQGIVTGSDGATLISTTGGIRRLAGGKSGIIFPLPVLTRGIPQHMLVDRDGALWVQTWGHGLLHIHEGRTDSFAQADGLTDDLVSSLFEDREGNIWVATVNGLDRFRELQVVRYSRSQGVPYPSGPVLPGADGSIWLSTFDGLSRFMRGHVTVYRHQGMSAKADVTEIRANGLADHGLASLFQDSRGRIWVSSTSAVGVLQNDHFIPSAAPGGMIIALAEDSAGNLWIAYQDRGLIRLSPSNEIQTFPWNTFGRKDPAYPLPDPVQGGMWLGFIGGGLGYFRDGKIRASYSTSDGLGSGRVNQLQFDRQHAIWAATNGGLSRVKDGRVITLTSKNGLPCGVVLWMIEGDDGSVWLGMPCGLVKIDRAELDSWVHAGDRSGRTVHPKVFDNSDGARMPGGVGGFTPHAGKAPNGKLWFITSEGLADIDPRHIPYNSLLPPVHVEQITADRKTYAAAPGGNLALPPLVRDLEIDYTALSFSAPEKVRFRYKLEGHDREWQDVGNRRQAFYTDLAPRNYRFRVQACNNSGVWNEAGAFLDFSVAPTLYQTRWFQALCLGAFVTALALLYQCRIRYLARQFGILTEARVDERMRIARDLHDTLLQSFQGLLLKFYSVTYDLPDRPAEAQKTLESAIEQARQAITEGRDAIQGLRSCAITNDLAQAMTVLGEEVGNHLNGNHPPEFLVQVEGAPRDLAPLLYDDVYRIAGEALRNAFRHSFARRIEVEIRYDERQLRLRIRDDGKGIDPKFLGAGGRAGHFGLASMHERAKLLGGKLAVWSELDSGTEVELTVPASMAYARTTAARWSLFRKKDPVVHE
jgi:signal transduction histidine kinase/ligand-binding sensor domain-containing protein